MNLVLECANQLTVFLFLLVQFLGMWESSSKMCSFPMLQCCNYSYWAGSWDASRYLWNCLRIFNFSNRHFETWWLFLLWSLITKNSQTILLITQVTGISKLLVELGLMYIQGCWENKMLLEYEAFLSLGDKCHFLCRDLRETVPWAECPDILNIHSIIESELKLFFSSKVSFLPLQLLCLPPPQLFNIL